MYIKNQSNNTQYNRGLFLNYPIKEYIKKIQEYHKIKEIKENHIEIEKCKTFKEMINFFVGEIYENKNEYFTYINKIFNKIWNQGLVKDILKIKFAGFGFGDGVVAFKLFCKNFPSYSNDWIPAWHGTKIENLESIIEYGLKPPGTKLQNGKITPQTSYLPNQKYVLGIKNWEKAIFATPCLNCASMYSCFEEEKERFLYPPILVEVRIKPRSFTKHQSKELVGKVEGHGTTSIYHNDTYYRIPSEKNLFIKSIIFVKPMFLGVDFKMQETYGKGEVVENPRIIQELNNLFT